MLLAATFKKIVSYNTCQVSLDFIFLKSMHAFFMLSKACGLGLYKINSKGNLNFEMASLKLKKAIKSREKKIHKKKKQG